MVTQHMYACAQPITRGHGLVMGGECKQKLSSVRGGGRNYYRKVTSIKAGVHLKPVFTPLNLGLMRIARSHFKHSQNPLLIPQSYV